MSANSAAPTQSLTASRQVQLHGLVLFESLWSDSAVPQSCTSEALEAERCLLGVSKPGQDFDPKQSQHQLVPLSNNDSWSVIDPDAIIIFLKVLQIVCSNTAGTDEILVLSGTERWPVF